MKWLLPWLIASGVFGQTFANDAKSESKALRWASSQAVALPACNSAMQASDLGVLASLVQGARVVGLGEGTHGAREFLILRNRLFQYLVENQGFTRIIVETHPVHAEKANAYVQGDGELNNEIVESVFSANRIFGWSAQPYPENRELLEWMRAYNTNSVAEKRVYFYGMDERHPFPEAGNEAQLKTGFSMGQYVLQLLKRIPQSERVFVFAHNGHLRTDEKSNRNILGALLRDSLGDQLKVIGTLYNQGHINDNAGRVASLPPLQKNSLNGLLANLGPDCWLLDLKITSELNTGDAWFAQPQRIRGSHWQGQSHYFELIPNHAFDALIFIDELTPVMSGYVEP